MSNTTQKRPGTSTRITRSELNARLKEARQYVREMKSEGKSLPNPTKNWSKDSIRSLSVALGRK